MQQRRLPPWLYRQTHARLNRRELTFCKWYAERYAVPILDVIEHEARMKKERSRLARR